MEVQYAWNRYWVPRDGHLIFDGHGYLLDPEQGDGMSMNKALVSLDALMAKPCVVLLGEPGAGKSHTLRSAREVEVARIAANGERSIWADLKTCTSASELQGVGREVQFLWNRQLDRTVIPIDEEGFSEYVRRHLEDDICRRGLVLNREVQLRHSVGEGTGDRTDIQVDAIRDGSFDRLTVIVEAKGSWNPGLETAMQSQLRDRYLTGTDCQRGIYLVGWFASQQWNEADHRQKKVRRMERAALESRLTAQAAELSDTVVEIRAVILDATLPGAPPPLRRVKKKSGTSARRTTATTRSTSRDRSPPSGAKAALPKTKIRRPR